MRVFIKFTIIIAVFFLVASNTCNAAATKMVVSPLNISTVNSTAGFYPSVSSQIANDAINKLNRNLLYDVMDLNSTEDLIMSYGLWEKYKKFLSDYKDKGTIDYKFCQLIYEKLGIQKILLISSGFSTQNMVIKRSFLHRIGLIEVDPVYSLYRMDVFFTLIDTKNGLVDFERNYRKKFKADSFEVPSNSMNDNPVSTAEIKDFSNKITSDIFTDVCIATNQSAYTNVKSSIIKPRDGIKTRDGHSFTTNNSYLKNKRKESFKHWVKDKVNF